MKKEQVIRIIVRRYVSELLSKREMKNYEVKSISSDVSELFSLRSLMNLSKLHLFFIKSFNTEVVAFPFNF
jgi:hypothetical protein